MTGAWETTRASSCIRAFGLRGWTGLVVLGVVSALVTACFPTLARPVGDVAIRNESAQAVRVEIDRPAGFAGPLRDVRWVPPWRPGWCPAAFIGLTDQGSTTTLPQSRITLSGPGLVRPTTFPGPEADVMKGGLSITIDRAGAVHAGHPEPSLPSTFCTVYPFASPP